MHATDYSGPSLLPRLPFWASHSDWEGDMTEIRVFRGESGLCCGVIGWNHYEEERGERFKFLPLLLLPLRSSCSYIVPLFAFVCRDRQMSGRRERAAEGARGRARRGGNLLNRWGRLCNKKQTQISFFRPRQTPLPRRGRPLSSLSEVTNGSSHRTAGGEPGSSLLPSADAPRS